MDYRVDDTDEARKRFCYKLAEADPADGYDMAGQAMLDDVIPWDRSATFHTRWEAERHLQQVWEERKQREGCPPDWSTARYESDWRIIDPDASRENKAKVRADKALEAWRKAVKAEDLRLKKARFRTCPACGSKTAVDNLFGQCFTLSGKPFAPEETIAARCPACRRSLLSNAALRRIDKARNAATTADRAFDEAWYARRKAVAWTWVVWER